MSLLDPVLLAIVSVLCALAFLTFAGLWALVEFLGWWAQRERNGRIASPMLAPIVDGCEIDMDAVDRESDPWVAVRIANDAQWAGIEAEWHAFIDQFGVRS